MFLGAELECTWPVEYCSLVDQTHDLIEQVVLRKIKSCSPQLRNSVTESVTELVTELDPGLF